MQRMNRPGADSSSLDSRARLSPGLTGVDAFDLLAFCFFLCFLFFLLVPFFLVSPACLGSMRKPLSSTKIETGMKNYGHLLFCLR